jgi:hypothetical protein
MGGRGHISDATAAENPANVPESASKAIRERAAAGRVGLEVIPPICRSVPEPNTIEVLVSACDRAGNQSAPVEIGTLATIQAGVWHG